MEIPNNNMWWLFGSFSLVVDDSACLVTAAGLLMWMETFSHAKNGTKLVKVPSEFIYLIKIFATTRDILLLPPLGPEVSEGAVEGASYILGPRDELLIDIVPNEFNYSSPIDR